jgi:hypothetical protein
MLLGYEEQQPQESAKHNHAGEAPLDRQGYSRLQ